MIGKPEYANINTPLNEALAIGRPLIAVHRGTGLGSVAENTLNSTRAALRQGADIVEVDISASTDGEYFCFHDGQERRAFGIEENLTTLSSARIEELSYLWHSDTHYGVERLSNVLDALPEVFFNIDRSWPAWPGLLDYLRDWDPGYLLIKSICDERYLNILAEHEIKYPFIPIVKSVADIDLVLTTPGLNTVGLELISRTPDDLFCDPAYLRQLHDMGLAVFANAIVLPDRVPLFGGFDDEVSMFDDPAKGWGELVDRGVNIIQTDWPDQLRRYLE